MPTRRPDWEVIQVPGARAMSCACVARDAHDCYVLRYPPMEEDTEQGNPRSMYEVCECACHDEWESEERERWENEEMDKEYRRQEDDP